MHMHQHIISGFLHILDLHYSMPVIPTHFPCLAIEPIYFWHFCDVIKNAANPVFWSCRDWAVFSLMGSHCKGSCQDTIMSLFIIILSSKCQLVDPACNGRVGLLLSAIRIFYPHPLVRWKDCCDGVSFEVGSDNPKTNSVDMKATLSKFSLL